MIHNFKFFSDNDQGGKVEKIVKKFNIIIDWIAQENSEKNNFLATMTSII